MTAPTDTELETRHRALWALGDYAAIADRIVAPLGPELVAATGIGPGQRVLDVAAGTGNAALPAAATGARVVAADLCPKLLDQGRQAAAERGLDLDWQVANAEALPFADGAFDAVLSCIGVMFAPHHERAAAELVRVCRSGGTVGLLSWTPDGFIGRMFAAMRPFVPAPPPGVSPPPLWGNESYVRRLLGSEVADVRTGRRALRVGLFTDGAAFRDFFKTNYGPTIAAYRAVGDDPRRLAELDAALARLGDEALAGGREMSWEYLLFVARRR